jgi:hypothetical protein
MTLMWLVVEMRLTRGVTEQFEEEFDNDGSRGFACCAVAAAVPTLVADRAAASRPRPRQHLRPRSTLLPPARPCNSAQDGASPGVHYLMEMLIRDSSDAWLVPIPQVRPQP